MCRLGIARLTRPKSVHAHCCPASAIDRRRCAAFAPAPDSLKPHSAAPVARGVVHERLSDAGPPSCRADCSGRRPIPFTILVGERRGCRLGRRTVRRRPDLTQVRLGRGLDGLGQLVQHVGCLVHRAALVPGRRRHLLERFLEAERPVTGGQFRRDRKATRLQVDRQFAPALRAFPHADLEPEYSVGPVRSGTMKQPCASAARLRGSEAPGPF